MSAENSREGELAEFMTDHFFGHEDLQKRLAIVDEEGVVNEFGNNRASARPRLDRLLLATLVELFDLFTELNVYVRSFFI